MPADLPPETAYTYAAEYAVDQAEIAGAKSVRFSTPVYEVVDNFIHLPVGETVPQGLYVSNDHRWIAAPDGKVMRVLTETDGVAVLDDGTGGPMGPPPASDPLSTTWELMMRYLADRFDPGDTFWLVPKEHFSRGDNNMPPGRKGRYPPDQDGGRPDEPDPCAELASIIECENRTLGETIPITGTPYSLNYRSDRAPGRKSNSTLVIQVTDDDVPSDLIAVELFIDIAGVRHYERLFPTGPDETYTFQWDGKDWAGRHLVGSHRVRYALQYVYPGEYARASVDELRAWAHVGSDQNVGWHGRITGHTNATFETELTAPSESPGEWKTESVAGWNLSPHHRFDPRAQSVMRGDGTVSHPDELSQVLSRYAGNVSNDNGGGGDDDNAISSFRTEDESGIFAVIGVAGLVKHLVTRPPLAIAGSPDQDDPYGIGDGDAGLQAEVSADEIAVGDDGSVYVAGRYAGPSRTLLRKVNPNGTVSTVAGAGDTPGAGDNGPAATAGLGDVNGLAFGRFGELYIADDHRIRVISPDGAIRAFAGQDTAGFNQGERVPALQARFNHPGAMAIAPDGSLYVIDTDDPEPFSTLAPAVIRRIDRDGIVETVMDGELAALYNWEPTAITIDKEGNIFLGVIDQYNMRIIRVDAATHQVAVLNQRQYDAVDDLEIAPDGRLYASIVTRTTWVSESHGWVYVLYPSGELKYLIDHNEEDVNSATASQLGHARAIASAPNGDLYTAEASSIWGAPHVRVGHARPGSPTSTPPQHR